ncbi:MAG TPA: LLM class flavin-dependent oxidoreductase, partial [Candidatus Binatia bacterium]|nr:LLM class flavin-dependent oxidoreductase [Candidatus Binatia bacterium]
MKFGLLYEMETPRPWHALSEYNTYWEALAQIELADRVGFDYVWEVEHHFLEEYS